MEKLTVIKVGGAVVEDPEALSSFLDRFSAIGGNLILVHGGGREATRTASALGIESRMIEGRRVTDAAMLEIVTMAFAGMSDREFYPSKEEKAAKLGFDLISNHAFLDGNKRIGMYVMLTFLEANGVALEAADEDVTEAGLGVASGAWTYEKLLSWVRGHLT